MTGGGIAGGGGGNEVKKRTVIAMEQALAMPYATMRFVRPVDDRWHNADGWVAFEIIRAVMRS